MNEQKKHEMFLWGGVIGGVVILYVVFRPQQIQTGKTVRTTSQPPRGTMSSHPSTVPNPAQASVDEAFIQARAAALGMFDQTVLGEQSANDQLQAANNETQAQKVIAFNTNATQLKEAGLESTTVRDVAGTQASAEENIASQEANAIGSAEHTQQQSSLWGSILGLFSGIGSIFGFNQGTGSGTGYVDSNTGNPVSPFGFSQPEQNVFQPVGDTNSWDYYQIEVPPVQVPSF